MTTAGNSPYAEGLRKLAHDLRAALEAQQEEDEEQSHGG